MHIAGIGAVYGPQLPCCKDAAAAAASALTGGEGPACDPNCLEGDTQAAVIERMQAAIDSLTQQQALGTATTPTLSSQWFSGVSNTAVVAVAAGLGLILFLGRRR